MGGTQTGDEAIASRSASEEARIDALLHWLELLRDTKRRQVRLEQRHLIELETHYDELDREDMIEKLADESLDDIPW